MAARSGSRLNAALPSRDHNRDGQVRDSMPREPEADPELLAYFDLPVLDGSSTTARQPHAETGLVAAVSVPAEGSSLDDLQDAVRTTAETRPAPASDREAGSTTSPTVLIIEDTPELADLLEATLGRMPVHVAVARRGSHAVARIREAMPDVILLDIHLPDMTGWQVLEALKELTQDSRVRRPAVIVITAYGDPANRLVGKLQGVQQYLVKPLKPDEVEQVVQNALGAVR